MSRKGTDAMTTLLTMDMNSSVDADDSRLMENSNQDSDVRQRTNLSGDHVGSQQGHHPNREKDIIVKKDDHHVTSHHNVPPKESKWRVLRGCALCLFDPYDFYVVWLLCMLYVSAVLCCFIISAVAISMSQQLQFGEMGCITNFSLSQMLDRNCILFDTPDTCDLYNGSETDSPCIWYYNGQGFAFELLVGPLFDTVLAFGSIVMGFVADFYNRKELLVMGVLCWSAITALTGTVTVYWQLVILRFALAVSESGCTPFATSILADYFHDQLLATALGIYNWGLNVGYGLSFVLGNFLTWNRVWGEGWRWAFYIAGMPGLLLGVLTLFSLKEPVRCSVRNEHYVASFVPLLAGEDTMRNRIKATLKYFFRKEILLIALAAGVRQGAFYVWLYNCDVYYESLGQRAEEIGTYMSWSPVLGGSLGLVLGSYISDSVAEKWGTTSRIIVVIVSQLLAVPFCVATLLLPAPVTYFMDIPAQILGELWVSTTLALVIEISPLQLRTSIIGIFLFLVDFIAGWSTAFVPLVQDLFMLQGRMDTRAFRYAMLILYPGGYGLSVVFYCFALAALVHTNRTLAKNSHGLPDSNPRDGAALVHSGQFALGTDAIVRPPSYGAISSLPPDYTSRSQVDESLKQTHINASFPTLHTPPPN